MPFDHLTLLDIFVCEQMLRLEWRGKLRGRAYGPLHRMLAKRHPPIYDPLPPPSLPRIA
jgi:hypothetical protein